MKTKSNLIITTLVFLMLFAVNSCKEKTDSGNAENTALLNAHLITAEQGKILATEYDNNNYKIINEQRKTPDTKQIYYDIDVLEEYIQYVKAEAKSKGIPNVGITVAFGQYPVNGDFDKRLNKAYLGQQTVFLKGNSVARTLNDPGLDGINSFDFGQLTPPEN